MLAAAHDFAAVEHDDIIAARHRAYALGDEYLCAAYAVNRRNEIAFGLVVERGRRVVEQIQNIVAGERARDVYALALSARQVLAARENMPVESERG